MDEVSARSKMTKAQERKFNALVVRVTHAIEWAAASVSYRALLAEHFPDEPHGRLIAALDKALENQSIALDLHASMVEGMQERVGKLEAAYREMTPKLRVVGGDEE